MVKVLVVLFDEMKLNETKREGDFFTGQDLSAKDRIFQT